MAVTVFREVTMPSWMLSCPKCNKQFAHSRIETETLQGFFFPSKPDFPNGGIELTCPNCQHRATYQRVELTYRALL
jgi:ssDNA-binding Zn-finger/Zn-ribbon topoisomerase 1